MESEIIQPLDETTRHLARTFDCGNDALNNFLKDPSRLYDESFKTWVYLTRDRETIIGYFAISAGSLDQMEEGKREKNKKRDRKKIKNVIYLSLFIFSFIYACIFFLYMLYW